MPLPVTAARTLRPAVAPVLPVVALMWLGASVVAAAADGYTQAPWWLLAVNHVVLVPAAAWAMYELGGTVGGRALALVSPLLLVLLPALGVLYVLSRYRDTYVDRVLPVAIGIADGGRFPAAALAVVAGALALRSPGAQRHRLAAALAGVVAGAAALAHPSGVLVLVGIAFAYAVAWRPLEAGLVAAAATPGVLLAAASHGVALELSWDAFASNMSGLREYLWSNRLLQWLPLAGAIAAARGSLPVAFLLVGWFGAFALVYGASEHAPLEDGTFLISFVPALPAFCLLVASLPLLVPTARNHLERRL